MTLNLENGSMIARRYGVSEMTPGRWRDAGMPCLGKLGPAYMYDPATVDEWAQMHRQAAYRRMEDLQEAA